MHGPIDTRALEMPARRSFRAATWIAALSAMLSLPASQPADAQILYHSPGDDGVSGGVPATVPSGGPVTLHLYLDAGGVASTVDPCWQGDGDETCGYRMRLLGTGVTVQSFTPVPASVQYNLVGNQLDFIGGEYEFGDLGPTKIGDLVIDAPTPGATLDLTFGETVTTQLQTVPEPAPTTIVQVPEPGVRLGVLAGSFALFAASRLPRWRRSGIAD